MEVRARNSNNSNSSDSNNNLSMGELLHKAKEEERRNKRMAEKSSKNSIISAKKNFFGRVTASWPNIWRCGDREKYRKRPVGKGPLLNHGKKSAFPNKERGENCLQGFPAQRSAKFRRNFPPGKYRILSAWSEKEKP